MGLLDDYVPWDTPDGRIVARVASEYEGLRGQPRVCLVDGRGRVYHYDRELVRKASPGGGTLRPPP